MHKNSHKNSMFAKDRWQENDDKLPHNDTLWNIETFAKPSNIFASFFICQRQKKQKKEKRFYFGKQEAVFFIFFHRAQHNF